MSVKSILQLGNPELYDPSLEVQQHELPGLMKVVEDLHDTMMDFRKKYRYGKAIAAPQIGVKKRLILMDDEKPVVFINPVIEYRSEEMFELWDNCMSFPNLLVKVSRHKKIRIRYKDPDWSDVEWEMEDDLSELFQHEYDHLEGILAVQRAVDDKSLAMGIKESV